MCAASSAEVIILLNVSTVFCFKSSFSVYSCKQLRPSGCEAFIELGNQTTALTVVLNQRCTYLLLVAGEGIGSKYPILNCIRPRCFKNTAFTDETEVNVNRP